MAESPPHDMPGDPSYDPRDIVTPHAFRVDKNLLGTELAASWRRLVAILIDVLLATLLAKAGGVFVGIAVAFIFFRLATRQRIDQPLKRWARATLAFFGALILFATVVALIESAGSGADESDAELTSAERDSIQQATLDEVRTSLRSSGLDAGTLSHMPFMPPAVQKLLNAPPPTDTMQADTRAEAVVLVRQYAQALADNDESARDSLRPAVTRLVAGPQIDAFQRQLHTAGERMDQLEDQNDELTEQLNNPSLWRYVKATARDFGLSIGWIGVYFTIFLAWWNGQTPGKYLLGLRVVRLDGKPLTLWPAFERFGGYAAGLATGLLGFAQIYWDPNRQGIHDRIANTVVVRARSGKESSDSDI